MFQENCDHGQLTARRPAVSLVGATAVALLLALSASTAVAQTTTTVTVAWDRNTDAATAGYMVYYGTASGSYQWTHDATNQITAQLTLTRGSIYFIAVRAYNSAAQVGPPSNEITINLVDPAPPTAQITATLQNPTTALLTWSTSNAVSARINGTTVALSGSTTVAVSATTTFTLVATSASGATATQSATVTVTPAPTAQITATLQNPTTALVTWSTTNAVSARINGTTVALSGSTTVAVSATTTFTLVATSASGATATQSATVTVTPTPPPAPTAQFTASLQNPTTAALSWQTTNAVSVTINGTAVAVNGSASVPIAATTTYTLIATGAGGATVTRTATVTVTPPPSPLPSAPTTMAAAVNGPVVTLSWRAPTTGAAPDRYLLDVGTSPGAANLVSGVSVGNLLTISGQLAKGRYYARVRAANAAGVSGYSNEASFRVGRTLATPGGFAVTWQGVTAVLSWSPVTGNGVVEDRATAYVLEAGTASGLSDVGTITLGNVTTFRADVPPGTYYVRIRAVNDLGESEPTADLQLTAPGAPAAPTALTESGSGSTVILRWTAASGATDYILEAGTAAGLTNIVSVRVGNVTQVTTTAPPGTYYVRIRGLNASGVGPASNEVVVRR